MRGRLFEICGLSRVRPDRARWPCNQQRRGLDRTRRNHYRQVSKGMFAAQRNRRGCRARHRISHLPTRFGKVGMMVCYDGFIPEVARELANKGAEVIAWPVWGCNPKLASARACENH